LPESSCKIFEVNTLNHFLPGPKKYFKDWLENTCQLHSVYNNVALWNTTNSWYSVFADTIVFTAYGYHGPHVFQRLCEHKEIHPINDECFRSWFKDVFNRPFPVDDAGCDVIKLNAMFSVTNDSLYDFVVEKYGEIHAKILEAWINDNPIVI